MSRTGENIYKRKDGRWEARYIYKYDAEGKAKYRSIYGKSRQEVKQKRLLIIHKSMLGVDINASTPILFNDLAKSWMNNTKLRVKESTFAQYYNQVNKHILPHLGRYQASKISAELVEQLIGYLVKTKMDEGIGLSPKTAEDILIIIKNILKFGKCQNHLELQRVKIKKEYKKPLTLTINEQLKLHQYLLNNSDDVKVGILLSLHIGIRIGELCALSWGDINLVEKTIHVSKTLQRIQISSIGNIENKTRMLITSPKSKCSIRDIPIPNFLTEILCKLKKNENNYLLTGRFQYMESRTLQNHYKKVLKESNIKDYKFHSLRHTFATNYIRAGFDVKSLSEMLGHSSVKITLERYVHISFDLKRENLEKLTESLFYLPSKIPS